MVRSVAILGSVLLLGAQEAPTQPKLVYEGKPLVLPFACTVEDQNWGGLTCTEEEPCPVYLEISGLEAAGNRLFLTGNLHSAQTTLYSILLASEDGGRTWTEPVERVRGAGLDHVQFVDFSNGWISGQNLHPLPSDPFFLITNDGGKTWRKRPVFGENRVASIQQFWFDSAKQGTLIVDRVGSDEGSRYERYETPNGGDTWMIRESSDRPLKLRRLAGGSAETGWRARADAKTKAFQIERQQAGKWAATAAFLVEVGKCRPPAVVEAAPPTAEEAPEPPTAPVAPAPGPRKPPTLKKK